MIKAAVLQFKVGSVGGYKHTKMSPEAKASQSNLCSSRKWLNTFIESTGFRSSGMRSALCEPGRVATPPLHLNGLSAVPCSEQQGYKMASKRRSRFYSGMFSNWRGCPLKWTNDVNLASNSWSKHIVKPEITPNLQTNSVSLRCTFMVSSQQPNSASCMKQPIIADSGETDLDEAKTRVSPAKKAAMEQDMCILEMMESMSGVNISLEGCHSKVGQGLAREPSTGSQLVDGLSRCSVDCVVPEQDVSAPKSDASSSLCAKGSAAADEDGQFECVADETQKAQPKKETCSRSDDHSTTTAKSVCDRKKKRKKHSAKKRRRHKAESSSKCDVRSAQEENGCKEEKLSCEDIDNRDIVPLTTDCDSSEPGPSKPSCPLSVSKCSFFFNPAELSDGDHSDGWHDDCFDEFESSTSLCQDHDFLLDELNIFSPFMVWPVDQASSLNSSEEERYDNLSASDEGVSSYDMEVKKMLDEANSKWQSSYGDVFLDNISLPTKVQFPSEESNLYTVFVLSPEEVDAYREARIGKWEEFARDRQRFNDRIARIEKDIGYCLQPDHRAKIYKQLYDQHAVI